jgi:hypothetical protein
VTKIIDINKHMKPRLKIVDTKTDKDIDQLEIAMRSAMHSLRASRTWSEHKVAHLLNCREALDRVSFYLNDEIDQELGIDRDSTD